MRVVFRADSSLEIGSGHIMRCLTLAVEMRDRGIECIFFCQKKIGNCNKRIKDLGFIVYEIILPDNYVFDVTENDEYSAWLGCNWVVDAHKSASLIQGIGRVDWIIVDHYAIDARWESYLGSLDISLMVIDDLANRNHVCDILLDQTYRRNVAAYSGKVPKDCEIIAGSTYALLRNEFSRLRELSLAKWSRKFDIKKILITMGGIDSENATLQILNLLDSLNFIEKFSIKVILGENSPFIESVRYRAESMNCFTTVLVGLSGLDMAKSLSEAHFVIGAAGGTSWERCCLGVPTFIVILAENQRAIAESLCRNEIALMLGEMKNGYLETEIEITEECISFSTLLNLSKNSRTLIDGDGTGKVVDKLLVKDEKISN